MRRAERSRSHRRRVVPIRPGRARRDGGDERVPDRSGSVASRQHDRPGECLPGGRRRDGRLDLVAIDDDATAALMQQFYAALVAGSDAAIDEATYRSYNCACEV